MERLGVLFVCMGNICRSPAAEGVFLDAVRKAGLADRIAVESAGTIGYHAGEPADARMRAAARGRGYALDTPARQVDRGDFAKFRHIVAMDAHNARALRAMAPDEESRRRVRLFLEWHPTLRGGDVPDPYYGGPEGFEEVLDLVEAATPALLAEVRAGLDA
ncbi:MAG: low molecular weight protein-tyrosine-phosphatase [Candidatus Sumerlaeia bacterium]|nr:low molecular weight protein-tyrosine-phosphatase [Candidatus Sumerlaeia bacterium]